MKMNESVPFEEVSYFTGLDYSIFIVLLSSSLAIGIYFGFFSDELKTAEDYLVGGHKMRTIPIAISLVSRLFQAKIFSSSNFYSILCHFCGTF